MKLDGRLPYEHCVTRKGEGSYWRSCSIVFVNRFEQPGHELVPAQIQNRYQISFLTPTIHSWSRGESGVECCLLQFQRLRNTTKDVFPLLRMRPMLLTCKWVQSLGGEHMKKLVRISVVSDLVVTTQVALAANSDAPHPPQPVPPILHPHPGPIGPSGPVDPTPVDPPSM